jgi:hypothetical protein
MKKILMVFPVLLLVFAGIVMISCPSESEPGKTLDDYDILLKNGKYQHVFTDPKIEDGKEYEVIFTIDDCDEDFIGSRLGGKICYKMNLDDEGDKVLSGWSYTVPPTVSESVKTYTWTFKAGAKNSDNVTIENPATTPDGGKQYFSFTAQKGWDNWEITNPGIEFKIKGGFEVKSKVTITDWESAGTVTLGNDDGTAGKGAFSEADMEIIRALPPGSKIVFTVNVTVNTSNTQPGYGICSVGGWNDNNSLSIPVPSGTPVGLAIFTHEFEIAKLLILQPAGYQIAVNPYNGATVTKAELFKPKD